MERGGDRDGKKRGWQFLKNQKISFKANFKTHS